MPPARRLSPVFDALGCWALGKKFQLGARFGQSLSSALVDDFEQVSLLHKGGIAGGAGGAPVAHAEGVLRGVKECVDQSAARIHDATK